MRRSILWVAAVAALSASTACATTAGHAGAQAPAASRTAATAFNLCRQALPGHEVVSGAWTDVGDLRLWNHPGPDGPAPLRDAFPTASSTDPALWCWTRDATDVYTAWGAQPHGTPHRVLNVAGPIDGQVPEGAPIVP